MSHRVRALLEHHFALGRSLPVRARRAQDIVKVVTNRAEITKAGGGEGSQGPELARRNLTILPPDVIPGQLEVHSRLTGEKPLGVAVLARRGFLTALKCFIVRFVR